MRDLAAAAMGQYIPGGGATTGMQPQAVSLNTMQQQIAGQQGAYAGANPANAQQTWNNAANATQSYLNPGGVSGTGAAYEQQQQQGATSPNYAGLGQAAGNGTNTMGGANQPQYNLPAPNQIAAQSWNNMAPSQQQMFLGQYESQGWYKPDVEALMNQALPKYASNAATAGTWRLR
jgi:hypothetical protein